MTGTAKGGFLRRHVFSTDHKVIGKQYLLLGTVMAAVGGYLAYVFRHQLAWPGQPVPGFGLVGPGIYNMMVTMHGTIMLFWVAMPVLMGGFGNFLLPLMVGAEDMAFPRLNRLSFWTFALSTAVLVASFFVPGGAAAGGWTNYVPLSAQVAYTGVGLGLDLWIVAVALDFASVVMGGVNFLTTTLNLRAEGLSLFRLPLFVWMQVVGAVLFMFSVGPLLAGSLMLLLDRTVGTGFFSPTAGGDPLLWQHLFWFFGHPEVYVILLPALGIVAEVITTFARKALFGYRMIVYSTFAAGVLSLVVWAHHQFVSGMDPRLAFPFATTTILISVPFAITLFAFIATLWRGSIRLNTAMLFALGFIAEFLVGGCTGILVGSAPADIYVHATYFVVAHFHYTLFPSVFFGAFAGLYFWFPKLFGRRLNEWLGQLHFWGTAVAFNFVFVPLFLLGLHGNQRRIFDPELFPNLRPYLYLHHLATVATIVLLAFQVPGIVNLVWSLWRGPREDAENPWDATTLEWACPSPPPHGNFPEAPVVVRGPYDLGLEGDGPDFRPQWAP